MLAAIGLGLGLIGAYFVGRAMQSMLFGVRALDFSAFSAVALILLALPSWPATFLHGERRRSSRCACCGRNNHELRK